MKKILLFLSACAVALGVSAQVATVNLTDVTLEKNSTYNYQSKETMINLDAPLAVGDVVSVTLKGTISEDVDGLQAYLIECSEDNGWSWIELSGYEAIASATKKGAAIDLSFDVTATAASEGKAIRLYISTTNAPVDGVASVSINDSGVAPEAPYEDPILGVLSVVWGDNSVTGKTMTFGASGSGIGFANYDGGFDFGEYKTITITLTEFPSWASYGQLVVVDVNDETTNVGFDGAVAKVDLTQFTEKIKQIYMQCGGTGDVTLESITYSETADEGDDDDDQEPTIEAAYTLQVPTTEFSATYKEGVLDGYNATISLAVGETTLKAGDYVALAFDGSFDQDVTGISPAIIDQCEAASWWGELSGWDWTQMDATANSEVSIIAYVKLTADPQSTNLIASVPLQSTSGAESITFKSSKAEPTAVANVAKASFAIVNGEVISAGEIVVYNIAGQVVATANQVLEVASLPAGVNIITAAEGVIKFIK